MELERKYIPLSSADFKADGSTSTGPGEIDGYPSKFFDLDSYRDIVLPGAFTDSLGEFLNSGFICHSHEWGYDGVIGYPVAATEDEIGLRCTTRFHSTPDAQMVRTKAQERMAAGKSVGLSIGFRTKADTWIEADAFEEEIPKYVPADRLLGVMERIKGLSNVRLLQKIELYEYSIVTAPALVSATVTEVRNNEAGTRYATADEAISATRQALRVSMPLEWHSNAVRAAVEDLKVRCDDVIETRTAEHRAGRVISESNLSTLTTARAAMDEAVGALDRVIAAAEPKASPEESQAIKSRLLKQRLLRRPLLNLAA